MRRFSLLCAVLLFLFSRGALALDFTVDNTNDSGSGSLRQAISDSEGNPGTDNINIVATGTVDLTTVLPDITQTLNILGPGIDQFTVNAATIAGGGRIFTIDDADTGAVITVSLSAFSLTGGTEVEGGAINVSEGDSLVLSLMGLNGNTATDSGGAVFQSLGGSITISESEFLGNTAADQGGAIHACCGPMIITIDQSNFENNSAVNPSAGPQGGAVFTCCGNTELTITQSTFTNNFNSNDGGATGQGGAVFACCTSSPDEINLTIDQSTFTDNRVVETTVGTQGQGGAVFYCCSETITANISNSTFTNNHSDDQGGGIYGCCTGTLTSNLLQNNFLNNTAGNQGGAVYTCCAGGSPPNVALTTIDSSTFSGNQALPGDSSQSGEGGGFYSCCGPIATVTNSTFATNQAVSGGGFFMQNGDANTLTNCTFSGNSATDSGGGLFFGLGAVLDVSFLTISGNDAPAGGGVFNDLGNLNLINTIIAENTGNDCEQTMGSTTTTLGNNLDSDDSCGLNLVVGDLPSTIPQLDPLGLADNGGPTQTIALLETSPAVDHIAPADCNDVAGNPVDRDQRGVPRPLDGSGDGSPACDIGAYELARADVSITKSGDKNSAQPGDTVTYTLTVLNQGPDIAPNVVISDTLPAGVTFVSASPECLESGGVVTCDLGNLASGTEGSVQIVVTVSNLPSGTVIVNVAVVTVSGFDPNPDDNTASFDVLVENLSVSGSGCSLSLSSQTKVPIFVWLGILLPLWVIRRMKIYMI